MTDIKLFLISVTVIRQFRCTLYFDRKQVSRTTFLLTSSRFLQIEAQRAAARFEKASSQHEAAKEMVLLAEEGYIERGMPFDQAWQEMLNHSTTRVNYH